MLRRIINLYLIGILSLSLTWTSNVYALSVLDSTAKLTHTSLQANPPNTGCLEVLKSCDRALKAEEASGLAKEVVIVKQDELLKKQTERIINLEDSRDAWYNSKLFWAGFGILFGGYVTLKLKR